MLGLVYALFYYLLQEKKWNIFTRIISTANALQCIYMVYCNLNGKIFDIEYVADEQSLNALYRFSSYLLVDGIFMLPELSTSPFSTLLSVIHHFVGSLGIYLIASNKLGFFLGFYFAMTELSTPLLNISWFFRKPLILKIFYLLFFLCRIVTIPVLLFYLHVNKEFINNLSFLNSYMAFYGSYSLICLNIIWFLFLTKKIRENYYIPIKNEG